MSPNLHALINSVYNSLKESIISGLESGDLMIEDCDKLGYKIEKNMSQITSRGELLLFTQDLARAYPIFLSSVIIVKQASLEDKDKIKLEEIQSKLRSFTQFPTNTHAR